jgi:hypothetical protein
MAEVKPRYRFSFRRKINLIVATSAHHKCNKHIPTKPMLYLDIACPTLHYGVNPIDLSIAVYKWQRSNRGIGRFFVGKLISLLKHRLTTNATSLFPPHQCHIWISLALRPTTVLTPSIYPSPFTNGRGQTAVSVHFSWTN